MSTPSVCTVSEFQSFFHAKAFDIIGNGTFKKHLAKCKEANDMWAIQMTADIQTIQNKIRDIQVLVHEIPASPCQFFEICRDVMSSAQPPVKMYAGTAMCALTQNICQHCLDFSKIHKNTKTLYIDARFSNFFLFLWFSNKLEYVIRSYVRSWLEDTKKDLDQVTLCQMVQQDFKDKISSLHALFCLSYQHVTVSLQQLIHTRIHTPIVQT